MADKWYKDGLRFECTQCGKCCSGAPGFVWINDQEVEAMARLLEIDSETFRKRFVRQVGEQESLVEYPDGDCILLDPETRHCLVYSARPIQCRTWPFWSSNLSNRRAWQDTCRVCPGTGQGKLYTLDKIEKARKMKSV